MEPGLVATLVIVAVLGLWLWRLLTAKPGHEEAGRAFEEQVARILRAAKAPVLTNLVIDPGERSREIDALALVGPELWLIEAKAWRGTITVAPKAKAWHRRKHSGRAGLTVTEDSLPNPLSINGRKIRRVKEILREQGRSAPYIVSLVVFDAQAELTGEVPEGVMTLAELGDAVLEAQRKGTPRPEVQQAFEAMKAYQAAGPKSAARDHTKRLARMR